MIATIALAASMTYQATRQCSDGQAPHDLVGTSPVYFNFDENSRLRITTESKGPHGGVCLTTQRGTYHFDLKTLKAVIHTVETCGDCQPTAPADPHETSAQLTPLPGILRLRLDTKYGEGGSCRPGQAMIVDLRLTPAEAEPRCEGSPTS